MRRRKVLKGAEKDGAIFSYNNSLAGKPHKIVCVFIPFLQAFFMKV